MPISRYDKSERILHRFRSAMSQPLEDTLVNIWRQAMVEHAPSVDIDGQTYPVKTTKGFGLKQIDFNFGERSPRGLKQNPTTKSRGAAMAREGKNVMQFLKTGRYIAVVVDGKVRSSHRLEKE